MPAEEDGGVGEDGVAAAEEFVSDLDAQGGLLGAVLADDQDLVPVETGAEAAAADPGVAELGPGLAVGVVTPPERNQSRSSPQAAMTEYLLTQVPGQRRIGGSPREAYLASSGGSALNMVMARS